MTTPINTDKLYNASVQPVTRQAFKYLNRIDANRREVSAIGLAIVLQRVCEEWGLDDREVLKVADKIYHKKLAEEPRLRAIDQYIREELS